MFLYLLLLFALPPSIHAASSVYRTYSYYDGYLRVSNAVYATAQGASSADVADYSGTSFRVGQTVVAAVYSVYRGVLYFDTSSLPRDAAVSAATLSLYGKTDASTTNFSITVVSGALLASPPVVADYGDLLGETTSGGTFDTTPGFATNAYNDITLNAAGQGFITKGGVTKLALRSSLDISATQPADDEYVEIWSSEHGSSFEPLLTVTYTIPSLGTPSNLDVSDVAVFSGYLESGDQLYVFRYTVEYPETPPMAPNDYFYLQIRDGSTTKAQTTVIDWGYRPRAIYLSAAGAVGAGLAWGGNYSIRIIGNSAKFGSPPSASVNIAAADWKGDNLAFLDSWVMGSASAFGVHDHQNWQYYSVQLGGTRKLTAAGGELFQAGIAYLSTIRPGLFASSDQDFNYGSKATPVASSLGSINNLGTTATSWLTNSGSYLGVGGNMFGGILAMFAFLLVLIKTGEVGGIVAGVPILILGSYFGLVPMVAIGVISAVVMLLVLHQVWLKYG